MGWTVAKQPKKNPEEKSGRGRPKLPTNEKVSEPVKLRPTFKLRLQRVAMKLGVDMGVLIEERMSAEITAEYTEIVEQELIELRSPPKE